jgi:hypothetical protein
VPGLISGHSSDSSTRLRTCDELLGTGTISWTITWNTGATSVISATRTSNIVAGVVTLTFTGRVTSGLFAGQTVIEQNVGAAGAILLCTLGVGTVSNFSASMTLEILPI